MALANRRLVAAYHVSTTSNALNASRDERDGRGIDYSRRRRSAMPSGDGRSRITTGVCWKRPTPAGQLRLTRNRSGSSCEVVCVTTWGVVVRIGGEFNDSIQSFRHHLKTFLFRRSFLDIVL